MQHNVQPSTHADDEQAAVRRSVDAQFPAVAAFLASVDAPLMRDAAPQVSQCSALDEQCAGEDCTRGTSTDYALHRGPGHGMRVSFVDEPLLPFELAQWGDGRPELAFFADGSWPGLTLAQVDELLLALDEYTGALRVARGHLAAALRAQHEGR
jgi:hypothetical protein